MIRKQKSGPTIRGVGQSNGSPFARNACAPHGPLWPRTGQPRRVAPPIWRGIAAATHIFQRASEAMHRVLGQQTHKTNLRSSAGVLLGAGLFGLGILPATAAEKGVSAHALENESTLAECLEFAAHNNAGLKAAHARWRGAMERIPESRSLPDPRLSYGYFARSVETRVGPQQHKLGVAQTFPWFGKRRLRGDVAGSEAQALYESAEAAKLKLFHRVRHTWHELAYLRRAIEITESNIRLLKDLEGVAQTKVQGGAGLAGVATAQVELGKLEDRRLTLLDLKEPLSARFNAALGRTTEAVAPWPKTSMAPARRIDDDTLLNWLTESNPELRGLDSEIVANQKAVELARKNYNPDVTFGVDYTQTDRRGIAGIQGDGKDPVMAMFSINIPLWRKKQDAALQSAQLRREAVLASRSDRENLLRADLKMALHRYRDAERKIDLYRDTLTPLAEQSLSVAQQSWEAGKADFLNVIDAERQLLEFRLQYERARANREQCLSEIEMLVGRELPAAETRQATNSHQ